MRRSSRVPVVALLALVLVRGSVAAQAAGVTADKEGWWSRGSDATAPIGAGLPTETVPDGAIAVAGTAGQVDKVAAIGLVLDAERGSIVERFTLTLVEAEGTGAQQNEADAAIVACPVTEIFSAVENGALADAPAVDCDAASAEGVRNDDGTWTFDLAPIADAWLDPFGTLNPNGIRLDPASDSAFQTSFTGMEDATFDVAITPPIEDDDPFDDSTTTVPGGFTGSSGSSGSGSGSIDVAPPPAVDATTGGATPTTAAPTDSSDGDEAAAPAEPTPSRAGDTTGNLPGVAPLVLLLGSAVAVLIAWQLGPAGRQPHAKTTRSGGVSRALAARTTSTGASS